MTAPTTRTTSTSDVEWTQQRRDLWTGRLDGMPAGTIERGRRYTYIDLDGVAARRCRSLDAAQEASRSQSTIERRTGLLGPFVAGAAMAAFTIGTLIAIAGPHLS